jgi:predicted anti-sigma-YlaC factor YlaD
MSANCNIVTDLLPSYTDGLTSEESNQLIEEHLTSCESCKKEYMMMKEVSFPYKVDVPEPATETDA